VKPKRREQIRPRGTLRTPVSIRLEFAHWKALQDFREFELMQTSDDPPLEDDADILKPTREHQR